MNAQQNTQNTQTSTDAQIEQQLRSVLGDEQARTTVQTLLDTLSHKADTVRRGETVTAASAPAAAPGGRTTTTRRRTKGASSMSTHPVASQAAHANAPTMQSLMDDVTDLGKAAGEGQDVQIKFDLKVCEAAFLGSLSLDANKHGQDVDDATKLSQAYATAANKALIFNAKAPNQRKLISTTRKMIKLGTTPKWGVGEPMATVNKLISLRQKLRADPANSKKLDDAHNTLMRYATQQLKRDAIMDDDELKGYCFKKDPEARTGEEVLEAIRKLANNLANGKVSNCADLDSSTEVKQIAQLCTKRLAAIARSKAPGGSTAAAVSPPAAA